MNAKQINIPNNDKNQDKLLQDLKIEYFKYKNNLSTIVETHKNLKNRIDKEINRGSTTINNTQSNAFNCKFY